MAGYRATEIRKPANETEFEKNCVVLFCDILRDENTKRLGTKGQRQHGVDIVGHRDRNARHIVGIQCKLKSGRSKLSAKEVRSEVEQALKYQPPLSEYFIVTTSKDDTKLAQLAQQLMLDQANTGRVINIEVWGWDTLQEKIDQSKSAKQAFDPGFSPSIASQDRKLETLVELQRKAASSADVKALAVAVGQVVSTPSTKLPEQFAERELRQCLTRTLQRRGFPNIDIAAELAQLANRAISGDLTFATGQSRAEICDRAARAHALPETIKAAERFRHEAYSIDSQRDLTIADAVLKEAKGDLAAALQSLRERDDPDARSALFTILLRQENGSGAMRWIGDRKLSAKDLNAGGAMNLIIKTIQLKNYDSALAEIDSIPGRFFDECPALRLIRAQLSIATVLPPDRKEIVFNGLPLNPRALEIASGQKGQEHIQTARRELRALLNAIDDLQLGDRRQYLEEMDLWLGLEGTASRPDALKQLSAEMSDPQKTLHRVRLALAYGIPVNVEALNRHLISQREIGGWTADERFAAFLLALHHRKPETICDFFDRYRTDLYTNNEFARGVLAQLEVEALARIGRLKEAKERIALHLGNDLTEEHAEQLRNQILQIEEGSEIDGLQQQYDKTNDLGDLRLLVDGLRVRRDTKLLSFYAPKLARITLAASDFDTAIKSLFSAERHSELLAFTNDLPEIYELDLEYKSLKGWAFYKLGSVMEARTIARELLEQRSVASDRELAINTSIESGDWGHLQAVLAKEATRIDALKALELIRLARIALEVGSPYVQAFKAAALRKRPNDPVINSAAYMLAVESGTREEESAHLWLQKAIAKSGKNGPIRRMSMRDLVEQAPKWHEHAQKIELQLRQAAMPMFVAVKGVRRQLLDLIVGQALRNTDGFPIKYPIFTWSGRRPIQVIAPEACVAFDTTALVSLDYLGLLEKALDYFKKVRIAPSTLGLLFADRQFLKIQQPSEIAKAERIQARIATGRLKVLPPTSNPEPNRRAEIGEELAALLAAARNTGGIVVTTAPVSKIGSYLDENADMTRDEGYLTDTLTLLDHLAMTGKIDLATRQIAQSYLSQVDEGWKAARPIDSNVPIYLDDLTVTYLEHTGLLDATLQTANVFISASVDQQSRETLRRGRHSEQQIYAVDRIRSILAARIESGRIQFSNRTKRDPAVKRFDSFLESSPTLDLLSDLTGIDIVIADDRCLNKLATWTDSSKRSIRCHTSLDVLLSLASANSISEDEHWRARHRARAAGFYAVPCENGELRYHLAHSRTSDGEAIETPELRAIRESLLLPKIQECFLSEESEWLNKVRFSICTAIRDIWNAGDDFEKIEADADWLWSILPNPLEWCLTPEDETTWAIALQQLAAQIGLLALFADFDPERKKRYANWLEKRIVANVKATHPDVWEATLAFAKIQVPRLLEIGNAKD